jgi:hypothetical protein
MLSYSFHKRVVDGPMSYIAKEYNLRLGSLSMMKSANATPIMGWAGLGWAGLGWAGLDRAGLGWAGLGLTGLDWAGLSWAGLS